MFQSTHPHGVRHIIDAAKVATSWVSIHAPTRGATVGVLGRAFMARFQSTHPHGVRLSYTASTFNYLAFQSTHPHGVRL